MSVKLVDLLDVLDKESGKKFIFLFNSYDEFIGWEKKVYSIHQKLCDGSEAPRITWEKYESFMNEHLVQIDSLLDTPIAQVIGWTAPEDYPEDGCRTAYIKA